MIKRIKHTRVDSKNVRRFLFLLAVSLNGIPALAQLRPDSTTSTWFRDFNFESDIFNDRPSQNDSILVNAFFYDKLKQQDVFVPVSGNPGSASLNYFDNSSSDKLLSDGFIQFSSYEIDPLKDFPSGKAERRTTNINYSIGSKKEQHIFLKHEQKIKPGFIIGLDFGAMSAPGDFSRTLNTNRNLDIYFGFEAPSKVYRTYASFTADRVENQENGGISSDSAFENASSLNTRTLPINLLNATIRHKSRDYFVKQELNLTRLINRADSSERADNFKTGSLVLNYTFWYDRKSVLFTSQDADSGYFDNYYVDTVITYDSSFYNDLYQVSMLEYTTRRSASGRTFNFGSGFEYEQNEYLTGSADTTFKSGAIAFAAGFNSHKIHSELFYSKSVYGDFEKGYRARFRFDYIFGAVQNLLYFNISTGKLAHSAKEILYDSNHFRWNNKFNLLEQHDVNGGIFIAKFRLNLDVRSRTAKNMVFYREDCLPQTYGDYISVNDISVSNILKIRKFGLDTKLVFSSSSNENVAPVSPVSIFASLYYQNRFFKNVLGFKAGFDVSYYSEYYGYGYMPATGVFYVQNEKKIGNYPQVGVFVNMKIKAKATLFIRLDHANSGLSERTYYGAYHYPLPGRTFKFGINWDLVD